MKTVKTHQIPTIIYYLGQVPTIYILYLRVKIVQVFWTLPIKEVVNYCELALDESKFAASLTYFHAMIDTCDDYFFTVTNVNAKKKDAKNSDIEESENYL